MSDVVGCNSDINYFYSHSDTADLIDKNVEVFLEKDNVKGICPFYNGENYLKNDDYSLDYYPYVLSEDDYWKLN